MAPPLSGGAVCPGTAGVSLKMRMTCNHSESNFLADPQERVNLLKSFLGEYSGPIDLVWSKRADCNPREGFFYHLKFDLF